MGDIAKDWELVRVFDSAKVTDRNKTATEATLESILELDGDQTRAILLLDMKKANPADPLLVPNLQALSCRP